MVRSSLGRAVLVDSGLVGSEEYPFYGISVPDFLALTEWLPHEALKASGKVKQMGETDEVIFCSHQWCSFSHPDPAGNQLCGNQNFAARSLNHRVVLHAIDATPARWRGDAGSSPLDGASTAASLPRNDLVKNCRVH